MKYWQTFKLVHKQIIYVLLLSYTFHLNVCQYFINIQYIQTIF